jgi:PAS domain S-box-containing protein
MTRGITTRSARYALAALATAFAMSVVTLFEPAMFGAGSLLVFALAAILTASIAGVGPGLIVTAVGGAASLGLVPFVNGLVSAPGGGLQIVLFAVLGSACSVVCGALREARRAADDGSMAAARAEHRYRRILETAAEGIWTVDARGRTSYANRALADLLGVPLERALASDVAHLFFEEDRSRIDETLARVRHGEHHQTEVRLRRGDGTELWTSLSCARIVDDERVEVLGVFTDLSRTHLAEASLAASLEAERKARAEAEEANRSKDELVATVSHELRSPLNAIVGWTGLLRSGKLDDAARAKAFTVIERNAFAQARLLEDLLDLTRMRTGKLSIELKPVAIGAVVQRAIEATEVAARERRIRLTKHLPAWSSHVLGDPARLEQVATNLLSNAIKFTPANGTIEVRAEGDGDDVVIEVTDSGRGIDASFLPHVFERFRQADATVLRGHTGLGLGLSIVKHIVDLHGGTVGVTSEGLGRGTTFSVRLPTIESPGGEEPRESSVMFLDAALDGLRALVVDDEDDARELTAEILRRAGAAVRTAACTRDAIRTMSTFHPDVVVSDLSMPGPGGNGLELLEKVRSQMLGAPDDTPAIAVSGHARAEDRARAFRAGFQRHLAKPVDGDRLILSVRDLVCSARR